jgi:hypothetical protein
VLLFAATTVSVQTVAITVIPQGETFTLTYASATTSALAYNVTRRTADGA